MLIGTRSSPAIAMGSSRCFYQQFLRGISSKSKTYVEEKTDIPKRKVMPKKMSKPKVRTEESPIASYNEPELSKSAPQTAKEPVKFISLKDFPKAPQEVLNQSVEQLYTNINLKPWININTIEEPKQEDILKEKRDNYVDFMIPDKYLKSKVQEEVTNRDRAFVEELDNYLKGDDMNDISPPQLNLIKLYYDQNTNSFHTCPEHTLKRSLSGMINLNPSLDDIDDSYLWKVLPEHKLFGVPPFEQQMHGFKYWEQEMIEKERRAKEAKEVDQKEFKEVEAALNQYKSFFNKSPKGGRRKLDRKLLKKYKKLKEEGKIPDGFIKSNFLY